MKRVAYTDRAACEKVGVSRQGTPVATFLRQPGMLHAVNLMLSTIEQKPTCCVLPSLRWKLSCAACCWHMHTRKVGVPTASYIMGCVLDKTCDVD